MARLKMSQHRPALEQAQGIRAKTKFIVLDCCFGGGGLEALPANFSQTDLRSEINLLGSFAVASAGKNVKALVPEASNYTAFSGTVCDVIEKGIEFAGALLSIDEVFREVRRIMLESSYPVPIRVSSIDDDLIALAPNRRFIPENEQLRFRINVMSERLQVYGRYFRQSNEYHRQAIQQLREQDSRVAALLETLKQSDAELAKQISSLKEFETSIRDLREQKADGRTVVRRIGWVYIAIIFGCALSIVASVVIVFNISNAT